MATTDLIALEPIVNAKGAKTCPVFRHGGASAFWVISGACRPLFDPSAFKGNDSKESSRLSLCLNCTPEGLEEGKALDQWAVAYALAHSEQFFGKVLTADQCTDRYSAIVKESDKYPPYVRVKVVSEGRGVPNWWTEDKQKRDAPTRWSDTTLKPNVRILGYWFMGNSFGLTVQMADAQVLSESASASCPF